MKVSVLPDDMVQAFDGSVSGVKSPQQPVLNNAYAELNQSSPVFQFNTTQLSATEKFLIYGVAVYVGYMIFKKYLK